MHTLNYFSRTCFSCNSQKGSDKESIENLISKYRTYTINENFEGLVDLMHPDFFKKYSKSEVINDLKEGMPNDNYDIAIKSLTIDFLHLETVLISMQL